MKESILEDSLLYRTGQAWKLTLCLHSMWIGQIFIWGGILVEESLPKGLVLFIVLTGAIGIIATTSLLHVFPLSALHAGRGYYG